MDSFRDTSGGGGGGSRANGPHESVATTIAGRPTAKSHEELKKARESRATEALKMKDEQLRILSEQNASLLSSLDKVEEEANTIQMEKLAIEQENRSIRDNNFELQSKARAAETQSKRMTAEVADKDSQIRILTDQSSELLRLLESEENVVTKLQGEVAETRAELDELRQKYAALLSTAKTHEELATKAAREGQLRAEEIRLLRTETEQLKQQNAELKMKTQVEVEALQEQLRVRKEKQYQLLEKLQAQEEAKRQAEDQVAGMEEQLRGLHARNVELETQLQVETRSKQNLEETNKELVVENGNLFNQCRDLQLKIEKSEKERLRMESEARDSGEQVREMAEKVFQLLERLKLAELGKTKAMEALKKKEQDMVALQKKNGRLIKEATEEGRARTKAELDVKVLQDQVRTLKKHNQDISQKSKEEAALKLKAMEDCEQLQEKLRLMESRLSFLLNKVQVDEDARLVQAEDRKKLEAQVMTYTEKTEELQHKLTEMGESNRVIAQAMRLKQEEVNETQIKYDALSRELEMRDANESPNDPSTNGGVDMTGARPGGPDDIENVRLNEGRGRFYVEAKSIGGGSLLVLRGRKPLYREWLDKQGCNEFLKRVQKTTRFRDLIVEKFAAVYGLLMVEEEEKLQLAAELSNRENQIDHLQKKFSFVQDMLATEEDAKRRMLLRYIHAVKEHAMAVSGGTGGVLVLPESNISDEEVHALAALLRNNMVIDELNLRGNNITDDGARALGAVLAGRSGLRLIDLRGNKISKGAIRILAEALERSERVRHVYVHAGGKIEALGAGRWAHPRSGDNKDDSAEEDPKLMVNVETICVVDVRDNNAESTVVPYELASVEGQAMGDVGTNNNEKTSHRSKAGMSTTSFNPTMLLEQGQGQGQSNSSPQHKNNNSQSSKGHKSHKNSKMAKSQSVQSMTTDNSNNESSEAAEKRRAKQKLEEVKAALKEASWHGRQGGLDRSLADGGADGRESVRLRKKNMQRGDLPPLSDIDSYDNDGSNMRASSRGHSAPMNDSQVGFTATGPSAETTVLSAINKARGSKQQTGKIKNPTETEKRLFHSPFAIPVVNDPKINGAATAPIH